MDTYWLLFFSPTQARRSAVLRQLLSNSQKESALYWGMIYGWLDYINVYRELSKNEFDSQIQRLVTANFLHETGDGYLLTEAGCAEIKKRNEHFILKKPTLFRILNISLLNEVICLAVQVASEASYSNKKYYVVSENIRAQTIMKEWLRQYGVKKLAILLVKDLQYFLGQQDKIDADIFCLKLVGHNIIGKTDAQLAKVFSKSEFDIQRIWLDLLSRFCWYLYINNDLLAQIIQATGVNIEPVRKSRFETINRFKKGESITEIASNLKIKTNTIEEHLHEAFIWHKQLDLMKLLTATEVENLKEVTQKLGSQEHWNYKNALAAGLDVSFFKFRIFEIERGRGKR